jgi:hypothetical protein
VRVEPAWFGGALMTAVATTSPCPAVDPVSDTGFCQAESAPIVCLSAVVLEPRFDGKQHFADAADMRGRGYYGLPKKKSRRESSWPSRMRGPDLRRRIAAEGLEPSTFGL